jgi:hypothetical protein
LIPKSELAGSSPLRPGHAGRALDGDESSYWSGGQNQQSGQYFEIELGTPRPILALEISAPGRVMDVPVSFRLSAWNGAEDLGVILERPLIRLFREQIFAPEKFVFRVVLARPVTTDRVRITVGQPMPGCYFSIHELRLYAIP